MSSRPHPPALVLYGALLVHSLISAGTFLFAKRALVELHWAQLALVRFAGTSVIFALLLLRLPKGTRLPPPEVRRTIWWLALVAVPLNQGFFLGGLSLSTAAHAALLYTLTPLFVALLAHVFVGERLTPRTATGTAIALGGALFVLVSRQAAQGALSGAPLLGDGLILLAVLAWATYTAQGRTLVGRFGALRMIAWTLMGGTALFSPLGLALSFGTAAQRARFSQASPAAWWGILYLVIFTSVIAYLVWYWALAWLPAARVAVFSNLQPLFTAGLAHVFLGEQVTLLFLGGAAVVIGGVLLAQSSGQGSAPAPLPAPEG